MHKVRFHLAAGKNYRKWQVKYPSGETRYFNPDEVIILMSGAVFKNQAGTAQKIFDGAKKSVCAWIEAECLSVSSIDLLDAVERPGDEEMAYNPRIAPHWLKDGKNMDKAVYDNVYTNGRKVFV